MTKSKINYNKKTKTELIAEIELLKSNVEKLQKKSQDTKNITGIGTHQSMEVLCEAARDGIIMIDHYGKICFWNTAASAIFGYENSEIFGEDLHLLLAPEKYHQEYQQGFRKFQSDGTGKAIGKTLELEAVRKNGEVFPIELSLSGVKLHNNWQALGIVRDISHRKKTEYQLKVFERLAEASLQGFCIMTLDNTIHYLNPAISKLLHLNEPQDLIGQSMLDLYPDKTKSTIQKMVLPTLQMEGHWSGELARRTGKGQSIPTHEHLFMIRDVDGRPIYYANVVTDISDQQKILNELNHYRDHLEILVKNRTMELESSNIQLQDEIDHRVKIEDVLRHRQRVLQKFNRNLSDLAHSPEIFEGDLEKVFSKIGVLCSKALDIPNLSLWLINDNLQEIQQLYQYKSDSGVTAEKEMIKISENHDFFKRLQNDRVLAIEDVGNFAENTPEYFGQSGMRALLCISLRQGQQLAGLFCMGYPEKPRNWNIEELNFAASIADFISLTLEVSQRKAAESQIRQSQKTMQVILDSMPFGVLLLDEDHNIQSANHSALALFACNNVKQLKKRGYRDCFRTRGEEIFEDIAISKSAGQSEQNLITADGKEIPILKSGVHVTLGTKKMYLEAFVNVTEQKLAEIALKDSEERFRAIFEQSPMGVIISRTDTSIVDANPFFCELLGYSLLELQQLSMIKITHPDDLNHMYREMQKVMSLQREVFHLEIRLLSKSNQIVWCKIAGIVHRDHESIPDYGLAVVEDISERKQSELELGRTLVDLERSNKELEQFAYVASHDLQEPLRKIRSFTELFAKRYRGELDERADRYIHHITVGTARMQRLISDLLTYSRLNTSSKNFNRISCNTVMEDVISNLQVLIDEHQAEIVYSDLPEIIADSSQLKQLFQNLISNGIKFHSDANPRVEITAKEQDQHWQFTVSDNGIGIDMVFDDRIFIIFQRLHTQEEYPGTGIGLAISKKIVQRHGGCIWLESELGKGSSFIFTLSKEPVE